MEIKTELTIDKPEMRLMRDIQKTINFIFILACIFTFHAITLTTYASDTTISALIPGNNEQKMIEPADLFKDFPEIKWEMSFEAAKSAIEKKGFRAANPTGQKYDLVWSFKFNEMDGRGTILFKKGKIYEIAILIYAMEKRQEVFKTIQQKITERHQEAKVDDNSIAVSNLWKLKNGFVIEIRTLKEEDSTAVDVHWVKD